MKKFLILFAVLWSFPIMSSAAEVACTMEYAPVCGQPPMPTCPSGMACVQVMPVPQTYGNSCTMKAAGASLLYGGECAATSTPKACTKEYMPVCGMVQVQCVTAPCDPVRTDFGNQCMAEAAGAKDITGGTCQMSESTPPIVGGDKDTHGCIGSAGYSWDDSMQSCIRSWEYQPTVDWAYARKITKYNSVSEFKYGNTLTRQEAAAFITRYLIDGLGREEALCKLAYKDMDLIDESLIPSISRACGFGVMYGDNGYFHPRNGLTRGEAIAVLIRALDQKKQDETFYPWYNGYLDRAANLGLSLSHTQSFSAPISRGEFTEWLKQLSLKSKNDEILLGDWKLEQFTDVAGKTYFATGKTITFDSTRFSARLCNSMSGDYTARDGSITTGPVMSTMMACLDGDISTIEGAFDLDGATYAVSAARVMPGYTGSTMWVHFTTKSGAHFRFGK